MAKERIIGIDFGTSTSVIRAKRYEDGKPLLGERLDVHEVKFDNQNTVPTQLRFKSDDPTVRYYGHGAQEDKTGFEHYHNFKMDLECDDIGRRNQARELTKDFFTFLFKKYKDQRDGGFLGDASDKEYTLVSYPVKWQEETRAFMINTAAEVGFPNVSGMDEAQAAIRAVMIQSMDHLKKQQLIEPGTASNILLIDMGAGTTDLVLSRYAGGRNEKPEILMTWPKNGDTTFGGREIDQLLREYFRTILGEQAENVLSRISAAAFKSWKEQTLSPALLQNDTVIDFSAMDSIASAMRVDLEYSIDRKVFEDHMETYLSQFADLVKGCLNAAGMDGSEVDLVIVTGGHSQWYFIPEILSGKLKRFGDVGLTKVQQNPERIVPISRPHETVALGLVYSKLPIEMDPITEETPKPSDNIHNNGNNVTEEKIKENITENVQKNEQESVSQNLKNIIKNLRNSKEVAEIIDSGKEKLNKTVDNLSEKIENYKNIQRQIPQPPPPPPPPEKFTHSVGSYGELVEEFMTYKQNPPVKNGLEGIDTYKLNRYRDYLAIPEGEKIFYTFKFSIGYKTAEMNPRIRFFYTEQGLYGSTIDSFGSLTSRPRKIPWDVFMYARIEDSGNELLAMGNQYYLRINDQLIMSAFSSSGTKDSRARWIEFYEYLQAYLRENSYRVVAKEEPGRKINPVSQQRAEFAAEFIKSKLTTDPKDLDKILDKFPVKHDKVYACKWIQSNNCGFAVVASGIYCTSNSSVPLLNQGTFISWEEFLIMDMRRSFIQGSDKRTVFYNRKRCDGIGINPQVWTCFSELQKIMLESKI